MSAYLPKLLHSLLVARGSQVKDSCKCFAWVMYSVEDYLGVHAIIGMHGLFKIKRLLVQLAILSLHRDKRGQ
jgi:hypothetical protein